LTTYQHKPHEEIKKRMHSGAPEG